MVIFKRQVKMSPLLIAILLSLIDRFKDITDRDGYHYFYNPCYDFTMQGDCRNTAVSILIMHNKHVLIPLSIHACTHANAKKLLALHYTHFHTHNII